MRLPFTRLEFVAERPKRQLGMSISGYQPKLSLAIDASGQLDVVTQKAEFILKPSPEAFPNLAENEHATMCVMKMLGFDVPPFGLVRFKPNREEIKEKAFLIRRFDRDKKGLPIHQEQLDAAMNISEKYGKTQDDGEGYISYERAGTFLLGTLSESLELKKEFFQRVLTAYFLGNNDLHLRNFGILHPRHGKYSLAPIYDYV
jgi:serine/threonine-protein kinase HipA